MPNVVKATLLVRAVEERPLHFCPENEGIWLSK
jgi:hypothetical protein